MAAVPTVQASLSHSDVSVESFPSLVELSRVPVLIDARKLLEGSPVQASRTLPLCSCLSSAPSVGGGREEKGEFIYH